MFFVIAHTKTKWFPRKTLIFVTPVAPYFGSIACWLSKDDDGNAPPAEKPNGRGANGASGSCGCMSSCPHTDRWDATGTV